MVHRVGPGPHQDAGNTCGLQRDNEGLPSELHGR